MKTFILARRIGIVVYSGMQMNCSFSHVNVGLLKYALAKTQYTWSSAAVLEFKCGFQIDACVLYKISIFIKCVL